MSSGPRGLLHPFSPRLVEALRGYRRNQFLADLGAGLIVGVVALPLAMAMLIPTLTIAMFGAIESLLCARVADGLTHLRRHDPNQELMAPDIANVVASSLQPDLPLLWPDLASAIAAAASYESLQASLPPRLTD